MRFRGTFVLILAAAVQLLLAVGAKLHGQTGPAGQVTARMQGALTTPESIAPMASPSFDDLLGLAPAAAVAGPEGAPAMQPRARTPLSPEMLNDITKAIQLTEENTTLSPETKDQLLKSFSTQLAAPPVAPAATTDCTTAEADDVKMAKSAAGTAAQIAWKAVVDLDDAIPATDPKTLTAARRVACRIPESMGVDVAIALVCRDKRAVDATQVCPETQLAKGSALNKGAQSNPGRKPQPRPASAASDLVMAGIQAIGDALNNAGPCWKTVTTADSTTAQGSDAANPEPASATAKVAKASTTTIYHRPTFFPLFPKGCRDDDAGILEFFAAGHKTDAANSVEYLYNAEQSSSAVTGDLLTSTFEPGIQVILATTATVGNGSSSGSTTGAAPDKASAIHSSATSSTTTTSTDTVGTALAKLENGGDFNLRVPIPLLFKSTGNWSINGKASPNIGFTLNKFGGQQTITEATEYSGNFPAELYIQAGSIKDSTGESVPAVGFFDAQVAGEWVSSALAKKLSVSGPTFFPIVQVAGGIEFAQRFRISLQYIYSTPQFCQVSGGTSCSASGSGSSSTTTTTKINGFHLAVLFSPQKSKSKN